MHIIGVAAPFLAVYSFFTTVIVQFVAKAAMVPKAANHGAKIAPITPTVAGIPKRRLPFSSLTMILVTFPLCSRPFTFSMRSSDLTEILFFNNFAYGNSALVAEFSVFR